MALPPRPTASSVEVLAAAATKLLETLRAAEDWVYGCLDGAAIPEIVKAIVTEQDGARRAYHLWRHNVCPLSEKTTHIMSHASLAVADALAKAEAEWVVAHGARFPALEGDVVKFRGEDSQEVMGVVTGVQNASATGWITVPKKGADGKSETHVFRVAAEAVTSVRQKKEFRAVSAMRPALRDRERNGAV